MCAALLLSVAVGSANAATIHGLGFDTPLLADLADRSADAAASQLPVSDTDKSLVAAAIRTVLLDPFLPGGPTAPAQLFDNGFSNGWNDISADNFGNPLSIARSDFNTSLGVVGPYVDRVLGSPRLELLVETDALHVEAALHTSDYEWNSWYDAVATQITGAIPVDFMFDGYPPSGWLEGILGDASGVPGISSVYLRYAETESAYEDASTLTYSSVTMTESVFAGDMIWVGSADITPGAHVVYYYDVVLDTDFVTPEGDSLSWLRLPDPRNLQWVDRGALDRLAAAGLSFGDVGDTSYFDPSRRSHPSRRASCSARATSAWRRRSPPSTHLAAICGICPLLQTCSRTSATPTGS